MANKVLYDGNQQGDNYAQVIFSLEYNSQTSLPQIEPFMQKVCRGLKDFRPAKGGEADEQMYLGRRKFFFGKPPLQIPSRISGNMRTYTAPIVIQRSKLADNKLSSPWVMCRVAVGRDGSVQVVSYPTSKRVW